MRANPQLHDLECYGLIDRDYRCEEEFLNLRASGIYSIKVAEVENLFIVEELLDIVNRLQGFPDRTRVESIKDFIIDTKFSSEINRQIRAATIAEIKYLLSTLDVSGDADEEIQNRINHFFENFDYAEIKRPIEENFIASKNSRDYKKILALYNRKSLKDSIGTYFGLENRNYCEYVLRQLNNANAELIKGALRSYLPPEIPC